MTLQVLHQKVQRLEPCASGGQEEGHQCRGGGECPQIEGNPQETWSSREERAPDSSSQMC